MDELINKLRSIPVDYTMSELCRAAIKEIADAIESKLVNSYIALPKDSLDNPVRLGSYVSDHGNKFEVDCICYTPTEITIASLETDWSCKPKQCVTVEKPEPVRELFREFMEALDKADSTTSSVSELQSTRAALLTIYSNRMREMIEAMKR